MKKYNILFHTHSLPITGGSKSIIYLAYLLKRKGHEVCLILENDNVEISNLYELPCFYISNDGVISVGLNENEPKAKISSILPHFKSTILKRMPYIRKLLMWCRYLKKLLSHNVKKKHVELFLEENGIDLVVSSNMYNDLEHLDYYRKLPLLMSIRNSPKEVFLERVMPRLHDFKHYFKNIGFVSVSEDSEQELKELFPESFSTTIYNPFDFESVIIKSQFPLDSDLKNKDYFVIVGSLCWRKRVDLAISALAKSNRDDIYLVIIGTGEEEKNLIDLSEKLLIANRVIFKGHEDNPYNYMKKAIATILTSESEGLPRVLVESLIVGTTVIARDCPTGPRELLSGELKNNLVENTSDGEIIISLADKFNITFRGNSEYGTQLQKFNHGYILEKWELIFEKYVDSV